MCMFLWSVPSDHSLHVRVCVFKICFTNFQSMMNSGRHQFIMWCIYVSVCLSVCVCVCVCVYVCVHACSQFIHTVTNPGRHWFIGELVSADHRLQHGGHSYCSGQGGWMQPSLARHPGEHYLGMIVSCVAQWYPPIAGCHMMGHSG